METKIDMPSENSDFRDHPGFTKRFHRDISIIGLFSLFIVVLVPTVICHADKIDYFMSRIVSSIYLGLSSNKIYSTFLLFISIIAAWFPFVQLAFSNLKILYFFRTRRGR